MAIKSTLVTSPPFESQISNIMFKKIMFLKMRMICWAFVSLRSVLKEMSSEAKKEEKFQQYLVVFQERMSTG